MSILFLWWSSLFFYEIIDIYYTSNIIIWSFSLAIKPMMMNDQSNSNKYDLSFFFFVILNPWLAQNLDSISRSTRCHPQCTTQNAWAAFAVNHTLWVSNTATTWWLIYLKKWWANLALRKTAGMQHAASYLDTHSHVHNSYFNQNLIPVWRCQRNENRLLIVSSCENSTSVVCAKFCGTSSVHPPHKRAHHQDCNNHTCISNPLVHAVSPLN